MHQRVLITDKLVNRIRRNLDNPQKENPRFGFLRWISCDMKWRYIKKNHPRPVQDPWDLPPLFANYLFSVLGPPPWQNIQFQLQTVIYWKPHFGEICSVFLHNPSPMSSSPIDTNLFQSSQSYLSSHMSLMNFLQLSSTTLLKILSWKNCCNNRPYHCSLGNSCSCTMKLLWCGFLSCTSCPSLPRSFLPQVHYLLPPSAADSPCQYNWSFFTQLGRISRI